MKRFIVSILCVSVFFIGLGSLVEKAGAKFKSDPRALEIIKQARQAIGGEAAIANVRSMTITGTSTHNFVVDGMARSEAGSLEINLDLPTGKFGKMSRIGNPDQAKGAGEFQHEFDVRVVKKGDGAPVFKNDNGDNLTLSGDKKIIVRKADGTTEEINAEGNKKFVIKKMGEGEAHFRVENSEVAEVDGKKVILERAPLKAEFTGVRQNELLRTAFALLLTAPEETEATYAYLGEGNVDGYSCDIVEVQSMGASFKLFLDKQSHLPRMLSYQGMKPVVIKVDKNELGGKRTLSRENFPRPETVEYQVRFSDFRSVSGVQLPHRWTQTVGGNPGENVDITSYEINPVNIAEKFQAPKVKMRTEKIQ